MAPWPWPHPAALKILGHVQLFCATGHWQITGDRLTLAQTFRADSTGCLQAKREHKWWGGGERNERGDLCRGGQAHPNAAVLPVTTELPGLFKVRTLALLMLGLLIGSQGNNLCWVIFSNFISLLLPGLPFCKLRSLPVQRGHRGKREKEGETAGSHVVSSPAFCALEKQKEPLLRIRQTPLAGCYFVTRAAKRILLLRSTCSS